MPLDPPDPTPRRIILPGESAPPAGRPLAPDDAPAAPAAGPRIVLPPGVAGPEPEDLPEYPRLRPLEIMVMREGERVLFTLPRVAVVRQTINHLIHHRGQLSVYLRLVDVPLPSIYGPTADEPW